MRITNNIDFSAEAKEVSREAIATGEITTINTLQPEIKTVMHSLLQQVKSYRQIFEIAYKNWILQTEQDSILETAITKNFEKGIKIPVISKNVKGDAAEELAEIMLQGLILLTNIRQQLTGTQIETVFYIQDKDGNIKRITNAGVMKPALSLYSASGTLSNPINLAYSIQQDCLQGQSILEDEEFDLTHYITLIDKAKEKYLSDKSNRSGKTYSTSYDSKDMEILELLIQRKAKTLTWTNYASYRNKFGNKGKQTTAIEMGDVGNIQVKFFGKNQQQANALRFSLLRNKISELEEIFSLNEASMQYAKLKEMFIPNTSELHDEFSKEVNRIALANLKQLFRI